MTAAAGLVQSSCKLYDPSNRQTYTKIEANFRTQQSWNQSMVGFYSEYKNLKESIPLTIVKNGRHKILHFDFSRGTWVEEAGTWDRAVFVKLGSNPLSISALQGEARELAGTLSLLSSTE
ncbi:hypothetical protein Tsubulata_006780, partial [Turnera subulata]